MVLYREKGWVVLDRIKVCVYKLVGVMVSFRVCMMFLLVSGGLVIMCGWLLSNVLL